MELLICMFYDNRFVTILWRYAFKHDKHSLDKVMEKGSQQMKNIYCDS